MNAVGPADHGRVFELQGALLQNLAQALQPGKQQRRRFADLQRLGGVHDVVRGQAIVQVAALAAHVLRHVGGEGDHVVLHLALDLQDALDFKPRLLADGARGALGNQPGFRLDLRRGDFHVQPFLEFVLVGPDAAHFRACVARNHRILDFRFVICDFHPTWGVKRRRNPTTTVSPG